MDPDRTGCLLSRLFRPAREATPAWNLTKTLAQTAVFWSSLLWMVPLGILRVESSPLIPALGLPIASGVGWLILGLASLGGLWSGITMAIQGSGTPLPLDTARELVVTGPYRFVRNPMAVFGIGQGIGVSIIHSSASVLAYVLLGAVLWHILVRPTEERELRNRFGSAYEHYRHHVGLWVPGLGRDM